MASPSRPFCSRRASGPARAGWAAIVGIVLLVYTPIMSPERKRIDTDAIKQSIDLAGFARQYTRLIQISRRGEFAGPCPCCGGKDRFHIKGEHFYCRQCYARGGDVINLVQLIHQVDFTEACQMLTAGAFSFSEKQAVPSGLSGATGEERSFDWRSSVCQESARKTVFATHRLLLSAEGAPGQEYLLVPACAGRRDLGRLPAGIRADVSSAHRGRPPAKHGDHLYAVVWEGYDVNYSFATPVSGSVAGKGRTLHAQAWFATPALWAAGLREPA
ncbi:hypothetical protein LCGC14_2071700, partial [marine sediment metagenome]